MGRGAENITARSDLPGISQHWNWVNQYNFYLNDRHWVRSCNVRENLNLFSRFEAATIRQTNTGRHQLQALSDRIMGSKPARTQLALPKTQWSIQAIGP